MKNYVVTFARGFGTGGKEIASKLAKELGIHCYENRILTLASQLSGLDEQLFEEVNEKIRAHGGFSSFLKGLPRAKHKGFIRNFVKGEQWLASETAEKIKRLCPDVIGDPELFFSNSGITVLLI